MGLIGNGFEEFVYDQINVRQQYLGLTDSNVLLKLNETNNSNISYDSIIALNHAGTAWLRLASSVNVNGSNKLALDNVLFGGITEYPVEKVADADVINTAAFSYNKGFPYEYTLNKTNPNVADSKLGFRPPPALLGADISYLNDNGTLKKAIIKIKAFSPEQLDIIDKLYMRVGYSILLEWGHSIYITNDKKIQPTSLDSNTFTQFMLGKLNPTKLYASLKQDQQKYNGNYEGYYGIITNFNWTFNPKDATYDITVNAISQGQIIESLKANRIYAAGTDNDMSTGASGSAEAPIVANKNASIINNALYQIATKIGNLVPLQNQSGLFNVNLTGFDRSVDAAVANISSEPYTGCIVNGIDIGKSLFANQKYIRFKSLLDLLENYVNVDTENDTFLKFATYSYVKHSSTVSSDPRKILVYNSTFTPDSVVNGFKNSNDIGDIYLNVIYLADIFESLKDDKGQVILDTLLNRIFADMNYHLGGVNYITYKIDNNIVQIYDEQPTGGGGGSRSNTKFVPYFNVYGVSPQDGSFIKDISFNVTITNEMATMITVGAQASGQAQPGYNATSFSNYNRGLVDRIMPKKYTGGGVSGTNISSKRIEYLNKVYLNKFGSGESSTTSGGSSSTTSITTFGFPGTLPPPGSSTTNPGWGLPTLPPTTATPIPPIQATDEIITALANINVEYMTARSGAGGGNGIFFLPFDMTLTMKGLGGIRIFDRFKLTTKSDDILPSVYRSSNDEVSIIDYIIFDIRHSISNNKWETSIRGKTVPATPTKGGGEGGGESTTTTTTTTNVTPTTTITCTNETTTDPLVDQSTAVPKTFRSDFTSTIKAKIYIPSVTDTKYKWIFKDYLPELEVFLNLNIFKRGMAVWITGQAIHEGFYPGSLAYQTNNPGNIGNTDSGNTHPYPDLRTGIFNQFTYASAASEGRPWADSVYPNFGTHYKFGPVNSGPKFSAGRNWGDKKDKCLPAMSFDYQGELGYYLRKYATGPRIKNSYLEFMLGWLAYNNIQANYLTKLKDIFAIN